MRASFEEESGTVPAILHKLEVFPRLLLQIACLSIQLMTKIHICQCLRFPMKTRPE